MSLTAQQQRAVDCDAPVVVCTAGAGSGKTRVLTERAARLVTSGVPPAGVLAVTFTRLAAGEMQTRLRERLGEVADRITVSTLHSWCAGMLRSFPATIGRDEDYTIFDAQDVDDVREAVRREAGVTQKTWAGAVRHHPELVDEYRRRLASWNALDFDGLIGGAFETLRGNERAARIYHYPHVLVDEVQDTAPAPFAIFDALSPRCAFFVGDFRQAIYSFQGADLSGLRDLLARPGSVSIELRENFRSKPQIVDVANACAAQMELPGVDAAMVAARDGHGLVERRVADGPEDVAERIADAVADYTSWGLPPSHVAVLAREWRHLDGTAAALAKRGIPAALAKPADDPWKGGAMRVLLWCLRAAVNPRDGHAARSLAAEVVHADRLAELRVGAARRGLSLLHVDESLRHAIEAVRDAAGDASTAADVAVRAFGLREHYLATDRLAKVVGINDALARIDCWARARAGRRDVKALLDWTTFRDLAERTREAAGEGVFLGSVHAAKGLEWPAVVVVDWHPRADAEKRPEAFEEERRCFYVALTRARDELVIVSDGQPGPFAQ